MTKILVAFYITSNLATAPIREWILLLSPRISKERAALIADAVTAASGKYNIHPQLLIAIGYQESGFQTRLPVGPAGEIGPLQILRVWVKNPKLKKDMPNLTESDLDNYDGAFKVAAWILRDLQDNHREDGLPYWTKYNAISRGPRAAYQAAVTRHLRKMGVYNE